MRGHAVWGLGLDIKAHRVRPRLRGLDKAPRSFPEWLPITFNDLVDEQKAEEGGGVSTVGWPSCGRCVESIKRGGLSAVGSLANRRAQRTRTSGSTDTRVAPLTAASPSCF